MAVKECAIRPEELAGVGVLGLADTPGLSALEMQEKLEETARGVIIPKFNALIHALAEESCSEELGATDPVNGTKTTVGQALLSLLGVTVHTVVQELTAEQRSAARENIRALTWESDRIEPGQQTQARENIGAVGYAELEAAVDRTVRHDKAQALTAEQKEVARGNIGAVTAEQAAAAGAAAVDAQYFNGVGEVMPEKTVVCSEPIGMGAGSGYRSYMGEADFASGWIYDAGLEELTVRFEDSTGVQEAKCRAFYYTQEPGSQYVYYGNLYLRGRGEADTGENFLLAFRRNYGDTMVYSLRQETVKVAVFKQTVSEKYLPQMGAADAVTYTAQALTEEQKAQARENIGVTEAEKTGVTAGTYGSYSGNIYYIPSVTVDEHGKVTAASTCPLSEANTMASGLMSWSLYNYVTGSGHVAFRAVDIPVGEEVTETLTSCACAMTTDGSRMILPYIYGVYVYAYTDANKAQKYMVPVDSGCMKFVGSPGGYADVTVKCPEHLAAFNEGTVRALIVYEAAYGGSGTGGNSM